MAISPEEIREYWIDEGRIDDWWHYTGEWSWETFGPWPERGPEGPLAHLQREVKEAIENPGDIEEYADLMFLVADAVRRAGFDYHAFQDALWMKLAKNMERKWGKPDAEGVVEHLREEELCTFGIAVDPEDPDFRGGMCTLLAGHTGKHEGYRTE